MQKRLSILLNFFALFFFFFNCLVAGLLLQESERKNLFLTSSTTSLETGAIPLFLWQQHHYLPLYSESSEERPRESTQL